MSESRPTPSPLHAGSGVHVERSSWSSPDERREMIAIRHAVFIEEQGVPAHLERDVHDAACAHVLAFDATNRPIGTARMQQDGHIGRIAVVSRWRRRGVGSLLVAALIEDARSAGLASVDLDSQIHAVGFYQKLGFAERGDSFMEAGIAHQNMALDLEASPQTSDER